MDIKKLNPWNWFKHEDSHPVSLEQVPVKREVESGRCDH